ncbi:ComF family protein [Sphaerisporangium aureirubrum]|uniref:ComF family protein n=1 Tax=Sphaerisporangium aureirubrum TaxID=1544736 RepID=A0ABW1NWG7_9ACTN
MVGRVWSAFLDLVLPPSCAGCARPGAIVCSACAVELSGDPAPRPPHPPPRGLPQCWSAAPYQGAPRRLVLAYKERGRTALVRPLADALVSVLLAVPTVPAGPLAVVPVPSARSAVRRRGHDPIGRLAAAVAHTLRSLGWPVVSIPALEHRRRVHDQAGLNAPQRAANLAGALVARPPWTTPTANPWPRPAPTAILVDDIITTGTTLSEAATTLRRTGLKVPLAITLTATPRHTR